MASSRAYANACLRLAALYGVLRPRGASTAVVLAARTLTASPSSVSSCRVRTTKRVAAVIDWRMEVTLTRSSTRSMITTSSWWPSSCRSKP